jgi:L-threonylcarbamoyladenylate synthase
MTVVLAVDARRPDAGTIARAAACLRGGGLVAFPTETVYGLGAHALDPNAVRKLFEAKARPAHDPLIVHVSSLADARELVTSVPPEAEALAARFWPGPLTIVLLKSRAVPDEVTAGLPSVAIRVPSHPVAQALLRASGVPIAAPSANLFSRPSPTRAAHVVADLDGRIDMVLDGGTTRVGVESTVVDLTGPSPSVLRPGGVSFESLAAVLGITPMTRAAVDTGGPMPSPGLLERHYSPRAPLTVYEGEPADVIAALRTAAAAAERAGSRVGLLLMDGDLVHASKGEARALGPLADLDTVAANLYAALRELDAAGVDVILVHGVADTRGIGAALRDRLRRAAAGRVVQCSTTND